MGQTFTDSEWKAQIKLKPELRTNNTFSVIGEYCEAKPYIDDNVEIKLFYVKDNTSIKIATPSYISYTYPVFRFFSDKKIINITQQSADNSYGIISLTPDYDTFNETKFKLQVKDASELDEKFSDTGLIIQFRIVKDTIVTPLGFTASEKPDSTSSYSSSINWRLGTDLDKRFSIKIQNGFLDSALDIKAGITQVEPENCYPTLYRNFKNNPYNISDYSVLDVSTVTKGCDSNTGKNRDGIVYYFDLKDLGLTTIVGSTSINLDDYCYFRGGFNNTYKLFNTNKISDDYCSIQFTNNLYVVTNPVKTITAYEYETVSLRCTGGLQSGTAQRLTFTWQKQAPGTSNWVQVYSQTTNSAVNSSSTYNISNPTIKDSGTSYRCIISYFDSSGGSESVTTTISKLTVKQASLNIKSFEAFSVNADKSLSPATELYNYSNVKFVCKWNDLPAIYKGSKSNLAIEWQFKRDNTWKTVSSSDIDFDRVNAVSSITVQDIYYSQKTIAAKAKLKLTYSEGDKTYTISEVSTSELSLSVKEPKISSALTTTPVITKIKTNDEGIIQFNTNFITTLTYSNILVDDSESNTVLNQKCVVEYMVLFYQNNYPFKVFNFKGAAGDWQVQEISEFKAANAKDTSQMLQKTFDPVKHTLTFKLTWNNNFSSEDGGLQSIKNNTNIKIRVKTRYKHSGADNDFTEIVSENDMVAWESDKVILDVKSDTAIIQKDTNGMATAISIDKGEAFELNVNTVPVIDTETDQVVWCIDGDAIALEKDGKAITDKEAFENEVHGILNKNDTGQYINWYVQEASDKQNNKTISVKFKKDVGV